MPMQTSRPPQPPPPKAKGRPKIKPTSMLNPVEHIPGREDNISGVNRGATAKSVSEAEKQQPCLIQFHQVIFVKQIQSGCQTQALTEAGIMFKEVLYDDDEAARKLFRWYNRAMMNMMEGKESLLARMIDLNQIQHK